MKTTNQEFDLKLEKRHRRGGIWRTLFRISTAVGIVALILLGLTIANDAFGYVVIENVIDPEELAVDGVPLDQLDKDTLVKIFQDNVSAGLFRRYEFEMPFSERSRDEIYDLVIERVVSPTIIEQYHLYESLLNRKGIFDTAAQEYPNAVIEFKSWLSGDFIGSSQSEDAQVAGVRTAIFGSLWTIGIAILFAFPIGLGAAIYLEEYAQDTWINRVIQTNINNLAGVPSIIYGILGLAIFVRTMERFTSGAAFGLVEPSATGRTVLSAGLTLGLLVLPLIIINSQEAIRAVPNSLRLAAYGLGATKWQAVWSHVLPNAIPGILTGTILAVSRAIGETAPLVVVGAATYITIDPNSPFSQFTTLPIQIYQWTARPQEEFHFIAAAAIIVLLALLLGLNTLAILLRNRFSRRI